MYCDAAKLLVSYKSEIGVLREQIRTMNLKLEEIVTEVPKNMLPRIQFSMDTLGNEITKSRQETARLQVQVDALTEEKGKLEEQVAKYYARLEALQGTIEG